MTVKALDGNARGGQVLTLYAVVLGDGVHVVDLFVILGRIKTLVVEQVHQVLPQKLESLLHDVVSLLTDRLQHFLKQLR